MNLSDTSIDSSVQSGILDNGESDIAANLQVNLIVTSSKQSDGIQDAKSVQDLVAENNRLVQENDAQKQRVAELEAAEAVGAGGEVQEEEKQEEQQEEQQAEEEQEKALLQPLLIQNLGHSALGNGREGELKELQMKLTE